MLALFSDRARLAAVRTVLERLAPCLDAKISVRLWDGSVVPLGPDADANLCIAISGPGVVGSMLRRPTLDNLMTHYAAGRIECQGADLWDFAEQARVKGVKGRLREVGKMWLGWKLWPFLFCFSKGNPIQHQFAAESGIDVAAHRRTNKDFIKFHYDVGNAFYQLFLGPHMLYSCNYFTDWNESLDQAETNKLEMICRKLRLKPGERLLDAGCGWGGLICYAAQHYGVTAHGMTLSQAQVDYARNKIKQLGLQDRVTVELRDAFDISGEYDKIASVGMFEHIGFSNFHTMLKKMYGAVRDRGIVLVHTICRGAKPPGQRFRESRPEHRMLRKYIFPGGELGNVGNLVQRFEGARFDVHDVEGWRDHYAMTVKHWCKRLAARESEAIKLVGPETYRMWLAYMVGMGLGFRDGTLRLFQVVASKHAAKGLSTMPCTRGDLYDKPMPAASATKAA